MAYSDHSTSVEPWTFRPASFLDPWFTDALSRDTETLTRALQQSFSSSTAATPSDSNTNTNNSSSDTTTLTPDVISPFFIPTPGLTAPSLVSNSFDIEPQVPKQRLRNGGAPGVSSRKVAKRKSRSTKRSQTTFINADAANFRQMVQQVTGSKLGHSPMVNIEQILRPEPHRPGNRFPGPSNGSFVSSNTCGSSLEGMAGCLPTLDTSAFLLDRHRNQDHNQQQELEQVLVEIVGQGSFDLVGSPPPPPPPASLAEEFAPFVSFPTLDSWNPM